MDCYKKKYVICSSYKPSSNYRSSASRAHPHLPHFILVSNFVLCFLLLFFYNGHRTNKRKMSFWLTNCVRIIVSSRYSVYLRHIRSVRVGFSSVRRCAAAFVRFPSWWLSSFNWAATVDTRTRAPHRKKLTDHASPNKTKCRISLKPFTMALVNIAYTHLCVCVLCGSEQVCVSVYCVWLGKPIHVL